jgi:uncharacterized protein (DUF2062 family)
MRGSPRSIAGGLAVGVALSLSPILGTHIAIGAGLAWIFRLNLFATVLGTFFCNPWTAPPIWLATYYVGRVMLGLPVRGSQHAPRFIEMFQDMTAAIWRMDVKLLFGDVWPVLEPMLLGSLLLGTIVGCVVYILVLPVVTSFQHATQARVQTDTRTGGELGGAGVEDNSG